VTTHYQSKYWASLLTLNGPSGSLGKLSRSISNSRVDLNPHQVDAALFAVRSPLSKGVVLADEVGLGKTIEAGLVLAQRWAERRRQILIIVPATLRKQWAMELNEKFHIPTFVLESTNFNRLVKSGIENPFNQEDKVVICSYHFVANKAKQVSLNPWDLVIIDEAHRLRNVYKTGNKLARKLRDTLQANSKLLLTATPLQNTLMELYGLVSFIDPHVFGDEQSFRDQFVRLNDEDARNNDLRKRLAPICHRTLRRQVLEYIKFTQRIPITWEFFPTDDEHRLYEEVSAYLQREELFALPSGQRMLMTMVLRKLLASSSFAIADTLRGLIARLEKKKQPLCIDLNDNEDDNVTVIIRDYDSYEEIKDEWDENTDDSQSGEPKNKQLEEEISALQGYLALAESIEHNAKGHALLEALSVAFIKTIELGGIKKAVVFTESQRTQAYLFSLLEQSGYKGQVAVLNGSNTDQRSKDIYKNWIGQHEGQEIINGSRSVDIKAAIVEEFRDRSMILVATEAAAEGVNLQFCSLVVNYDLPWNPQRIEQRIGRCHRYGQKHDVVVVNFLNKKNAADQRVYELLAEKFRLFDGVFGSSDDVLGALESGVGIERRIAEIYQQCRTEKEIIAAFVKLQSELDAQIGERLAKTRQVVLDHFDEEVQGRLRVHRDEARAVLDDRGKHLWALTQAELKGRVTFEENVPRFYYSSKEDEPVVRAGYYHFDWKEAERLGDDFFRTDHPLAQAIIHKALNRTLSVSEVVFDYSAYGSSVAILAKRIGQKGWLRVAKVLVDSIEQEEHLVVVAMTDEENHQFDILDNEWCDRLLSLPAKVGENIKLFESENQKLDTLIKNEYSLKLAMIETRNGNYFEEEVEKLDRWAEDVKLTLERNLKEMDAEIRCNRKNSKTAVTLAEKLEVQRRIKSLEKQRNIKRKMLFDAQDDVDKKRSDLIDSVERQLQTKAIIETVFTIRWVLEETLGQRGNNG
jgi:adenine-specific DNA-methyltransferase